MYDMTFSVARIDKYINNLTTLLGEDDDLITPVISYLYEIRKCITRGEISIPKAPAGEGGEQ